MLLERKLIGRMQNRWGPSRVGPFGLLQPLADGIKLFLKEDLTPLLVEKRPLFLARPRSSPSACALVPASPSCPSAALTTFHGVDICSRSPTSTSACWSSSASPRSASTASPSPAGAPTTSSPSSAPSAPPAQVISYELALGLSLVGVVLRAGSLNLRTIVDSQSAHGMLSWNILGGFQIVGFFIYLMSAYAETNRSPFDLPEAESELVAGYHTEYSSMKFAMFFMAEYANMITVGCVATLMFFGGASSPFGHLLPTPGNIYLAGLLSIFWFVFKVFLFLFLYIWVRSTLPRFRYDQLMGFGWKFLLPVAMLNIIFTSLAIALHAKI